MLGCRDLGELLGEYLDGELDSATVEVLEVHLAGCQECTAFTNTYQGTVRTTHQLREEQMPSRLRERLRAFLRQQNRS
ncbi:MAG: anti-sigma factor family protein [Candidatus Methylomirabilia bacterium]